MKCNNVSVLKWDSEFFKKRIASISMDSWDDAFLDKNLKRLKEEKIQLAYLFLPEGITLPDVYFIRYKCNLVDRKRVYAFCRLQEKEVPSNVALYNGTAFALYDLAIQAGVDSRYHVDPDFPKEDFERLYKAWIDNSLSGVMADYVLVYRMPSGNIGGFITLKKKGGILSIGLVATDMAYRRSGIGCALMDAAKHYACMNGIFLEVATQADNLPACSFYEKNGFEKQSQSTVYHIWL